MRNSVYKCLHKYRSRSTMLPILVKRSHRAPSEETPCVPSCVSTSDSTRSPAPLELYEDHPQKKKKLCDSVQNEQGSCLDEHEFPISPMQPEWTQQSDHEQQEGDNSSVSNHGDPVNIDTPSNSVSSFTAIDSRQLRPVQSSFLRRPLNNSSGTFSVQPSIPSSKLFSPTVSSSTCRPTSTTSPPSLTNTAQSNEHSSCRADRANSRPSLVNRPPSSSPTIHDLIKNNLVGRSTKAAESRQRKKYERSRLETPSTPSSHLPPVTSTSRRTFSQVPSTTSRNLISFDTTTPCNVPFISSDSGDNQLSSSVDTCQNFNTLTSVLPDSNSAIAGNTSTYSSSLYSQRTSAEPSGSSSFQDNNSTHMYSTFSHSSSAIFPAESQLHENGSILHHSTASSTLRGTSTGESLSTRLSPASSGRFTPMNSPSESSTDLAPSTGSHYFTPRVQIVDGKIVVDQDSLTIPQLEQNTVERVEVHQQRTHITSATYQRRAKSERWTPAEIERFYTAIRMCGTDFSMIELFFPNRSRRHVRNRYKREEKEHPERIIMALKNSLPLNVQELKKMAGWNGKLPSGSPAQGGSETVPTNSNPESGQL
ncbi:uncharacterized protein LOC126323912 [Schistocerca gregaria]|uniref:uncharacterized protein LOC126323912 n=1 Tax=Schistocerca gregaria TaxID=7010 RepID=UPI00211F176A|nr:uncharacterized protein LOC126323912 [Schistocerca gregaria]